MGGQYPIRCLLILGTLVAVLLSACASGPETHAKHDSAQAVIKGPLCGKKAFGEVKKGSIDRAEARPAAPLFEADDPSNAGRILTVTHPLGVPQEVSRIERGLVSQFVGKLTKDGLMVWSGIDLDRMVAVSVKRQIYDRRAYQTRAFEDPQFSPNSTTFARKFSNNGRIEEEVVWVFPISATEGQAMVCASNAVWSHKDPRESETLDDESAVMSDGSSQYFLIDHRQEQGVEVSYTKSIEIDNDLYNILKHAMAHAPEGPAW